MQSETGFSKGESRRYAVLKRVVLWTALFLFLGGAACSGWFISYVVRSGPQADESTAVVFIPRGSPIRQINRLLGEADLIHEDPRFFLLTKMMGMSARLPAGEFRLYTGQKPMDLIRELVEAEPVEHLVTIPEGLRLTEIAALFAKGGWADQDRFIERAHDRRLVKELGLGEIANLEGYLFPDTYSLIRPAQDEAALIKMLVGRALEVWRDIAVDTSLFSRDEVFTLASMVEKETGDAEERPVIAAVFLNRLKKKMRLQSDPTVIYGLKDFDGNLTRADLKTPTPYNTYTIPALPPGPICNPGKDALQAVLMPAGAEYLYFVSKNDGTHYFSKNLREHNRAVRTFQRRKKK